MRFRYPRPAAGWNIASCPAAACSVSRDFRYASASIRIAALNVRRRWLLTGADAKLPLELHNSFKSVGGPSHGSDGGVTHHRLSLLARGCLALFNRALCHAYSALVRHSCHSSG
jgi:hypothetical protein